MAVDGRPLRTFLAIPPDAYLRTQLCELSRTLSPGPSLARGRGESDSPLPLAGEGGRRRVQERLRWLDTADLHITLVFLGATAPDQVAALHERVRAIAGELCGFVYRLRGPHLFPDARRPRVLALEADDPEVFVAWNEPLARACAMLGFALESRRYRPHLSLARLRGAAAATLGMPQRAPLTGIAREVALFQSAGGHYRPLFSVAVEQAA